MSIVFLASAAAGNAVQVFLDPPNGAERVRLLRKRFDTINAADDAGANVVFDGMARVVMDHQMLLNGTTYFYRAFYLIGGQWVAADSRSVVPKADFADISPDVLDLVRERLQLGYAEYVRRGQLQHPAESIPVLLSAPEIEGAPFPFVTVHQQGDDPAERFVGESLGGDYPDALGSFEDEAEGMVHSLDGYLSRHAILIIVWSTNGDVRNAMRKAMKAIVLANMPVFESAGMQFITPSFSDVDDMNTYPMPMYQATCSLTCVAPTAVETRAPAIKAVEVILSTK